MNLKGRFPLYMVGMGATDFNLMDFTDFRLLTISTTKCMIEQNKGAMLRCT